MKIYRGRRYLGDQLIVESWFYEDDDTSMDWLEQFKNDAKNSINPFTRFEIVEFEQVGEPEIIRPTNPSNYVP